jgi:hypothetical protein
MERLFGKETADSGRHLVFGDLENVFQTLRTAVIGGLLASQLLIPQNLLNPLMIILGLQFRMGSDCNMFS